ncbi:MAG: tail fiber protein [Pyrinomonadaceae bacterium]
MAQPYIGEIRMFAGNFAPAGWAFCDGQLMPISENDALFVVIGTTYGGDGQETFALPDLRSRVPVHQGNGYQLGEKAGVESVTLTVNQIPTHSHAALCSSGGANTSANPLNAIWNVSDVTQYATSAVPPDGQMNAAALSPAGGSQPHDNMLPYLGISFILSLFGLFPTQ